MKVLGIPTAVLVASMCQATDHNNLEKERPLRFDDAYSIAFGSIEWQSGFRFDTFNSARPTYNFRSEIQWGFAKNKDISIGFEPSYGANARGFSNGPIEVSYFDGLRREIDNAPALGYRVEVSLPGQSGQRGVKTHLRGVLTKTAGQYSKLHLNLDFNNDSAPNAGERSYSAGGILGFSTPLGYPRSFNQTLLAEIGLTESVTHGSGPTGWFGIGIRRQMTPTEVFDIGIQTDLFAPSTASAPRSPLRFNVGYSRNF